MLELGRPTAAPRRDTARARRPSILLITTGLALLAGVVATSAQATPGSVRPNPRGKFLGVVVHGRPGGAASPSGASAGNLAYNGGPVMHSDANYAIFWEPAGHPTAPSYKATIESYFANVAADSGRATNVYATNSEYYDTVGSLTTNIAYKASYGGSLLDTQPYPASGCPSQGGAPCLTDAQIAAEVNRLIVANAWPRGLGTVYYVFFPPAVGSCFDATNARCSFTYFCAYHSSLPNPAGDVLYADMPYAAVPGCDPGQRPNGDPADAAINVVSHENNETITDPLGTAWYDAQGNENGDKCNFTFGSSLGGSSTSYYNQLIGGHGYWLQEEWSNAIAACAQRPAAPALPGDEAPTAAFTHNPTAAAAGAPAAFDGSSSADPDGSVTGYSWSFGDGRTAAGAGPSHTYAAGGTYTVTLQVTDAAGLVATTSQSITVNAGVAADESPVASFTFARYGTTAYTRFNGSGSDPDATIHSYSWTFGDGTGAGGSSVLHRYGRTGTYTVTLTAHDSLGQTATASHAVTSP